jgi:hypothetical protein
MSMICCYYVEFEIEDQRIQFEKMLRQQGIAYYDATVADSNFLSQNPTLESIECQFEGK